MNVVTRFAPSPTGYLHIGGARTALFNWLFARHHGGKFLLRIEDTDRARSTDDAVDALLDGLAWLGLDWDEEPVYQFAGADRHREIAERLLAEGKAYRCYTSQEELAEMRDRARAEGRPVRYDGTWRDRDPAEAPEGVEPVIRLKAPLEGETVIDDLVLGEIRIPNEQLDDMILLRSDTTPTYMLAVVVDDHDMGISHIIRGDDHLTNAARQNGIYEAMGWDLPAFAHVPMIHSAEGTKLSKRHGAMGVDAYEDLGYLPETMRNYLVRLGWGHGDDEIFSTEQAIQWFDIANVGKSPARFDFVKLEGLNGHYIREAEDERLLGELASLALEHLNRDLSAIERERLLKAMPGLKERVKTLVELFEISHYCLDLRPIEPDEKAARQLDGAADFPLRPLRARLAAQNGWSGDALEQTVRDFADENDIGLGKIAQPLRAALTGRAVSPGIFEVLETLGRDEVLARLDDILQ